MQPFSTESANGHSAHLEENNEESPANTLTTVGESQTVNAIPDSMPKTKAQKNKEKKQRWTANRKAKKQAATDVDADIVATGMEATATTMTTSTTTEQPDVIPHPVYPDRGASVAKVKAATLKVPLYIMLWTEKYIRDATAEQIDDIACQTNATLPVSARQADEQEAVSTWATDFPHGWFDMIGHFSQGTVRQASLSELRNAWFAVRVVIAHDRLKDDPTYRACVIQCSQGLMAYKLKEQGKSEAEAWTAARVEVVNTDDKENFAMYWTIKFGQHIGLYAAPGMELMRLWAQAKLDEDR